MSAEGDAGDPVLASHDASNTLYFSTLGFNTGENIQVFKSTDGGASFGAPVNGTPGFAGSRRLPGQGVDGGRQRCRYRQRQRLSVLDPVHRPAAARDPHDPLDRRRCELHAQPGRAGLHRRTGLLRRRRARSRGLRLLLPRHRQRRPGRRQQALRAQVDRPRPHASRPEVQVADLATTSANGDLGLNGGLRSNSFPHAAVNPVSGDLVVTYNDDPGPPAEPTVAMPSTSARPMAAPPGRRPCESTTTSPAISSSPRSRSPRPETGSCSATTAAATTPNNLYFHRRGRTAVMNNTTGDDRPAPQLPARSRQPGRDRAGPGDQPDLHGRLRPDRFEQHRFPHDLVRQP